MVIQKIRNKTQSKRTLLAIMVAVLIVGLLGSYFIWQSPDFGTGNGITPEQVEAQLASYEESIAKAKEELAAKPNDYSVLVNIASLYQAQGELLGQAGRYTDMPTSYANVIEYYTQALANKPAELNAAAEADIYGKIANANWVIGHNEGAEEAFEKALALDGSNWNVNYARVMYLYGTYGIDRALEAAKEYQALVKDNTDLAPNADSLVNQLQGLKDSETQNQQQGEQPNGEGEDDQDGDDQNGEQENQ